MQAPPGNKIKDSLWGIHFDFREVHQRLRVLEAHAEKQAAVLSLLLKNTERLVREKEVLLMHLGLTYLDGQTSGALPVKLDERWKATAADLGARVRAMDQQPRRL